MIISLAVSAGFLSTIKEKLYSFTGHVHIAPFGPEAEASLIVNPIDWDANLIKEVRKIPHVNDIIPFAERPVIIQAGSNMEGIKLKGVPTNYQLPSSISLKGNLFKRTDTGYSKQIVLSENMANRLDIGIGETVLLEFFSEGSLPRLRKLTVSGIYHSGMAEIEKYYAICDIKLLQRLNNWDSTKINAYQIYLDDNKYADTVANFIHYNLIDPPVGVTTTTENYQDIFSWLNLLKTNTKVLLIIMGIVAIINMGSVIVILIVDRTSMVGLLKALGMPNASIMKIFLSMSGIISGIGILLGNIFGLGLCVLQNTFGIIQLPEDTYYMKYAPIKIIWWQIVATDIITLVICILCMWIPALYIRRIQPAKALQFK